MEQKVEITKKSCEKCGWVNGAEAKFCGRCGLGLAAAPPTAQAVGVEADVTGQIAEEAGNAPPMGLGMAWMISLGTMVLWLGAVLMPNGPVTGLLVLVVHFRFGYVMTRYVMGGLIEFHPLHRTIANVFGTKLWMFLFWPLRMPVLLFKLTISSSL